MDHTSTSVAEGSNPASGLESITVSLARISFRNEANGWTVAKACFREDLESEPLTVIGEFGLAIEGQRFQLYGQWTKHPHYGPQFRVTRAVPLRPSTKAGIVRYLGSGVIRGIGPKTAERIFQKFGLKSLDILDQDPNRLSEVPSIGKKKLKVIIEAWGGDRATSEVLMFLSTHGISIGFAQKILKAYGTEAVKIVSENPYRLANDITGIGFRSADVIAKEIGIARDSIERVRAAIVFHLGMAEENGHCFLSTEQLLSSLAAALELDEATLRPRLIDGLLALVEQNEIFTERRDLADGRCDIHYRLKTFIAEVNISEKLRTLLANRLVVDETRVRDWLQRFMDASQTMLSDDQSAAVVAAVTNRVFILTGGPGVGKTTTANTIIRLFKAMGKSVALCAPTGRAAQRLSEVSTLPAKTIHRLLEWNPGAGGFTFDDITPLTSEVVLVDEASMLDVHLADALIRSIPRQAQLVIIGDVDQLPSVGPGAVLSDMIQSKVIPYRKLDKVFRQSEASAIIRNAHAINAGQAPEFNPASDCRFVTIDSPEQIRAEILSLMHKQLPREIGINPTRDIQVLTPMNRGELGTAALNQEIQELLNPRKDGMPELVRGDLRLRPGDKVIQNVNNYELGVFNGDIGIVQYCMVDGGKTIVKFGERVVNYTLEDCLELRLAYAITIHKSQGSEFPVVIIPCSMQHYVMLQRNLIYTALTRAKKLAVFVGTRKALLHAVNNQSSRLRQSMLDQRLRGQN